MGRVRPLLRLGTLVVVLTSPITPSARADKPGPPSASPVAQDRSVEAVVLTGSHFPDWSAGPEISFREPGAFTSDCASTGNHNCSQASRIPNNPREGAAIGGLIGFRWNHHAKKFIQIPFQVDERFTRYISNIASNGSPGFGQYAGTDAQLSYVFDRDAYRFTEGECSAEMKPGDEPEADPVKGLDDNDELAFLYRDTGLQAPDGAALPKGVAELEEVRIDDPSAPDMEARFAYVALAAEGGATPKYTADNGYVRYVRDADADVYEETSGNYGNAPRGTICDENGNVKKNGVPRRPRDTAWVFTTRYAFRYEGRWVLRGLRVAPGNRDTPLSDPSAYGPALIDQWKARAYQQSPGASTPCCGFETEQDNWGRSSVTLGERWGPVRVIRTTWGADSGTNTIRQEIFYPDIVLQQAWLRVHPIPPLGGIFSYWDHTAGAITKYYNPQRTDGVDVDGRNDEVFGTMYAHAAPDKIEVREDDEGFPLGGPQSVTIPLNQGDKCEVFGEGSECTDLDVTDPTLQATGTLSWEQVSGPFGAIVFRSRINELTPGAAQAFAAIPYYRDDSCFDDGTGIDPGPHLRPKKVDDPLLPCWTPGDPAPDPQWRQGAIGSHGVQVLFAAETDNAFLTVPTTELSSEQRMVVLPGDPGNVGDRFGLASDFPLRATVL